MSKIQCTGCFKTIDSTNDKCPYCGKALEKNKWRFTAQESRGMMVMFIISLGAFLYCLVKYLIAKMQGTLNHYGDNDETLFLAFSVILLAFFSWAYYYKSRPLSRINQQEKNYEQTVQSYQLGKEAKAAAELEEIKKEKEYAENSQSSAGPWNRYYTYPCPYCGHYKVRPANWDDKKFSVAFWGVYSSKVGHHYKCEKCGRTWS